MTASDGSDEFKGTIIGTKEIEDLPFYDKLSHGSFAFHNPFEASKWEVRYAGVTYLPYAHDTIPNAMQRFLAKWLLGVVWCKVESSIKEVT